MPNDRPTSSRFCLAAVVLLSLGLRTAAAADPPAAVELFESKIRPVLVDVCFKCHGGDKDSGSLRVDSREALIKGGDTAPAIVPNKPAESLLLKAIRHTDDDLKMPPDKRLPDETIAAFETWIAAGAPWPEGRVGGFEAKRHWAFQPIVQPKIPSGRMPIADGRKPLSQNENLKSQISDFRFQISNFKFQISNLPSTLSSSKGSTTPSCRSRLPPTGAR